jgi:hypothetical protein
VDGLRGWLCVSGCAWLAVRGRLRVACVAACALLALCGCAWLAVRFWLCVVGWLYITGCAWLAERGSVWQCVAG